MTDYAAARAALHSFVPSIGGGARSVAWPLPVDAPPAQLDEALAQGMPGLAFTKVREAGEGVVRVAFTFFVHEVLVLLRTVEGLSSLDAAERAAVEDVLGLLAGQRFTFGAAVHLLEAGRGKRRSSAASSALDALATRLADADDSLAVAWRDAQRAQPSLREAIGWLRTWRNRVYGHGFVGGADHYARLFDARATQAPGWAERLPSKAESVASPLPALLPLLGGASDWLAQAGLRTTAWAWPQLDEIEGWAAEATPSPQPAPVAWRGGPRPLYLLDRVERNELVALDVLDGEEWRLPLSEQDRALVEAAKSALRPAVSLFESPIAPEVGDRYADDPRRVKTKGLVAEVTQRIDAGHRRIAVTGAAGAGKSYLLRAVGDAQRGAGDVVIRISAGTAGALRATDLADHLHRGILRWQPSFAGITVRDEPHTQLLWALGRRRPSGPLGLTASLPTAILPSDGRRSLSRARLQRTLGPAAS